MRVQLLPSCLAAGCESHQYLTSFLINRTLAIDAGSLGFALGADGQAAIQEVLISHSHADHTASLPIFVENVYRSGPHCVKVRGSELVLDALRRDVFNGRTWPDFVELSQLDEPFLHLEPLVAGETIELANLRITPMEVNHSVPTLGFIIEDDHSAIVIVSDTGSTEAIWQRANQVPNLRAVFLEASFPNSMATLAEMTGHLTPTMFAEQARKLARPARLIAVHLKARYFNEIYTELMALDFPQIEVVRPGFEYDF